MPLLERARQDQDASSAAKPAENLPEPKANILLVDDRPDKLLALESILTALGQNIVKTASGKDALRQLLKQDFAVILLDVSMPGMDGFETAALIRSRPRSERTPIIFVTALGSNDNHISRGYSLGAVDYLMTPIVPEILRAKVSVFVELHKQTELVRAQAELLRQLEARQYQRQLTAVADRLEAETKRNRFFTLAIDLLGIVDIEGKILQANSAWEHTLGYPAPELCTRSLSELVVAEDREAFHQATSEAWRDSVPGRLETRFAHRDGSYRWFTMAIAPFRSENLLYVFAKDITARKESEQEIRRLNQELNHQVAALQSANAELEAFNYSIAHDLRAPLRSMSSFANALIEDEGSKLTAEGQEYATRIVRSAKYMDTLLQDLLAYSGLARTHMNFQEIQLEAQICETLSLFTTQIEARQATSELASPLSSVNAHLPTLRQILSNLVDNALKFCPADRKPLLRFRTTEQDSFVRLWVEDNGIGVAPEHHDRIFGLFRRLHHMDAYPGTGIGLALVRRAAERMGGRAGVQSVPGEGSCFWVDLPKCAIANP
jgi:PAS domain S-box-containing protein